MNCRIRIVALVLGLVGSGTQLTAQNRPNTRDGLWVNIGVSGGSLGVGSWSDRATGGSAHIAVGTTYNASVSYGVSSNVWFRSDNGENLNIASLMGVVRFYPSETGAFLTAGLGGARSNLGPGDIVVDVTIIDNATFSGIRNVAVQDVRFETREYGPAFFVGFGNDLRVGKNLSITPFLNGIFYRRKYQNANLVQVGVGLTWH